MKGKKTKIITDAINGSLIVLSILVYIILGLTIDWWHPGWILIVGTIMVVAIIAIVVDAFTKVKQLDEKQNETDKKEN